SELREGFCDPIQVTSKQWDDAAFFVEFEKRGPSVPFRLGVYADKQVWNPQGTDFAAIPPEKRPLASVEQPPFRKNQWTHVAFTFANFNNNQTNGISDLYLDGSLVASLSPRLQTFTWNVDNAAIMLGLSYVGSMDDLAIFNRALSAEEIESLYKLPGGVSDLKPAKNQ
ncbi:MAG: LamG domain-containing protein, partial [Pirellula sp.]|nr:LamG domain-containing protein [Pirellula sp.]